MATAEALALTKLDFTGEMIIEGYSADLGGFKIWSLNVSTLSSVVILLSYYFV